MNPEAMGFDGHLSKAPSTPTRARSAMSTAAPPAAAALTPEALLKHWQGHRRLTRRVIEAFPEDKLFTFSIGGMRPFSEFVLEFLKMAEPIVHGVATGEWKSLELAESPKTKAELL